MVKDEKENFSMEIVKKVWFLHQFKMQFSDLMFRTCAVETVKSYILNTIMTFEHYIALWISAAVQWDGFTVFFVLSSSFLDFEYTKNFLGNVWQPWMFLNFSATSTIVSYKLVSYKERKKECIFYEWMINQYLSASLTHVSFYIL